MSKPKKFYKSKKPRKPTQKDKQDIAEGEPLQLKGEIWRILHLDGDPSDKHRFDISIFGRIKSFNRKPRIGKINNPSKKYVPVLSTRNKDGIRKTHFVNRLAATHFVEKPSEHHIFVIHKNHDKTDNNVHKLAWATKKKIEAHILTSPNYKWGT